MGFTNFIKGELIDLIEWIDDSRDTLSFRFPDDDRADQERSPTDRARIAERAVRLPR